MSWFLRAVEQPDGGWLCRFGHHEFGIMPDRAAALGHLVAAATDLGGRHLFHFYLHGLDGSVETVLGTDPLPGE